MVINKMSRFCGSLCIFSANTVEEGRRFQGDNLSRNFYITVAVVNLDNITGGYITT